MTAEPGILVVDDQWVICDSYTRVPARAGFIVESRTQLGEDLEMAETDGIESLRRVRKKKPARRVVVVTGRLVDGDRTTGK